MLRAPWIAMAAVLIGTACNNPPPGPTSPTTPVLLTRGPFSGGRLDALVTSDANTLLVGSPGGGLWNTTNGGVTWEQSLSMGLTDFNITHLEYDRANSTSLFMTTYNGLYYSPDFGASFTPLVINNGTPAPLFPSYGANRLHTTDAYAFSQLVLDGARIVLYSPPCSGLYYSYDGTTFTQTWPFEGGSGNLDNCVTSIAADDTTGFVYFATLGGDHFSLPHLFRSLDAWTPSAPSFTWAQANSGMAMGQLVYVVNQASTANGVSYAPGRIAAVVSDDTNLTEVYVTENSGVLWAPTTAQPGTADWDPRPLVYPGGDDLFVGMAEGWQTQDTGAAFGLFPDPNFHPDVRAIYFGSGYMWDATDGTSFDQHDNIVRWPWSPGQAVTAPTRVPVDGVSAWQAYFTEATPAANSSGRRLYNGSQDQGMVCSDDQGAHWTLDGVPPTSSGDALSVRFAPSAPNRAYYLIGNYELYYSDNANAPTCAGVTWAPVPNADVLGGFGGHTVMAVHPTNPDKVYIGDGRNQLDVIAFGSAMVTHPTPAKTSSVFVDPNGALYIGTLGAGAFVSFDDGATWTPFGLNDGPPAAILEIAYAPLIGGNTGTFFLASTDGLYRLAPGSSWTKVLGGGGYTVSAVVVDPHCSARVYAGFGWVGQMGQHGGGVQLSTDNGATWRSITSGYTLQNGPVAGLQVDPVDSRYLYVASYGQGGWVYDYGSTPICPGGFLVFASPVKCVDVVNGNAVPGAQLQIRACQGNGEQSFIMGGNQQLQSAIDPTLCLEVKNTDYTAGYIQLATCNQAPAQQWSFASGQLHPSPRSDKCLEVSGTSRSDGTLIDLGDCSTIVPQSARQTFWPWGFAGVSFESAIAFYTTNLCLDVPNGSQVTGQALDNGSCTWGDPQTFTLTYNGQITTHNLCVEEYNVQPSSFGSVQLNTCTGGTNQSWSYGPDHALFNWAPTPNVECLDVQNGSNTPGQPIDVWRSNSTPAQTWTMELRGF